MSWKPTEDDLRFHMARRLEEAYQRRERRQMSREDFAAGYIAALIDLGSSSSFKDGRWMAEDD